MARSLNSRYICFGVNGKCSTGVLGSKCLDVLNNNMNRLLSFSDSQTKGFWYTNWLHAYWIILVFSFNNYSPFINVPYFDCFSGRYYPETYLQVRGELENRWNFDGIIICFAGGGEGGRGVGGGGGGWSVSQNQKPGEGITPLPHIRISFLHITAFKQCTRILLTSRSIYVV